MLEERAPVNNENASVTAATPRWVGLALAVLAILSAASLGVAWNASNRAAAAEESLAAQAQLEQKSGQAVTQRLTQSEETSARLQSDLGMVTDKLKLTQGELSRARTASKKLQEAYAKELDDVENAVRNELATKASTEEVNAKVGAITGDVSGVRGDLDAARRDFGMARSELGTLIARNHEEVEQLRRIGQRDYHEFTLVKKGSKERLGAVTVELRGVNVKRNQYTVALYADDKRFEKKNRSVNEPIFFYTRGARQPLELVIHEVNKNKITGYLSVPKAAAQVAGGQ
jgi:hypothetical protein